MSAAGTLDRNSNQHATAAKTIGDLVILYVIVEDMDCERGGSDAVAVFDDKAKADECIDRMEQMQANGEWRAKYKTSWFVRELELNAC